MSFVGTRPEAVKYVEKYKPEYMATLLLPAGITSEAKDMLEKYIESSVVKERIRLMEESKDKLYEIGTSYCTYFNT